MDTPDNHTENNTPAGKKRSGNRLLLIILATWFLVYLFAGLQKGPS